MAAENGHSVRTALDGASERLVTALRARQELVHWAGKAADLYMLIKKVYESYASASDPPDHVTDLANKVYQLEEYVTLDLHTHIGNKNGRPPYYLDRVSAHLRTADQLLQSSRGADGKFSVTSASLREMDHLAAEFQSTFNEYGFCQACEAIYDVEEATQKLEALSLKLGKVEKMVDNNNEDTSSALNELHDVVAAQYGMQQAMTEANIERMKQKFTAVADRVNKIEENFSATNIKSDSEFFLQYLACQHLLSKAFVKAVRSVDTTDIINNHMVHPGTRGWIFERFQRWLNHTQKRIYFIGGKEGSGKTALSSAICKLYSNAAVASYFCDRNAKDNSLNTVIQALAADLFKTMPEYLNWMDDKYAGDNLGATISGSWEDAYRVLLKEPLQALYGAGNVSGSVKRRVFVVDGVNQLPDAEWTDTKHFLSRLMTDLPACLCVFVTARTDDFAKLVPVDYEMTEGVGLEDKSWSNRHIKDIEVYLSTSLGAILSGEDQTGTPYRAKADEKTLQNTVDELIKHSGGRFDYAIELMETFAGEMAKSSGQFLSSLKKALAPVRDRYGAEMEENMREFSSPFRSYRDKEGRSVDVRVMRQNHYLMDKTRVALIRGRHKIHELAK